MRVEPRRGRGHNIDALDAVRSVFGRSATKQIATDQTTPEVAPFDELRRERDSIRTRLGDGTPDRSWDYRQRSEALARETHGRQGAQWRLDTARKSLQDLGPIGRRTHRAERRQLERRIAGFETDIARHAEKLTDLEARLTELTPEMLTRATWERRHSPELDRLAALDRQITWNRASNDSSHGNSNPGTRAGTRPRPRDRALAGALKCIGGRVAGARSAAIGNVNRDWPQRARLIWPQQKAAAVFASEALERGRDGLRVRAIDAVQAVLRGRGFGWCGAGSSRCRSR